MLAWPQSNSNSDDSSGRDSVAASGNRVVFSLRSVPNMSNFEKEEGRCRH